MNNDRKRRERGEEESSRKNADSINRALEKNTIKGDEFEQQQEEHLILMQMTGIMSKLPLEITFYILARVPIKSLSQCRWVCKSWYKIISLPRFAQIQHAMATKNFSPCVTFFDQGKQIFYLVDHQLFDNHQISTTVNYPQFRGLNPNIVIEVVGACHGLICLSPHPFSFFPSPYNICNPITGEYVNLPESPMHEAAPIGSGFGFDPTNNQYKVIRIMERWEAYIFTLGSPKWRKITDFPYVDVSHKPVFLNGALHWKMYTDTEKDYSIGAFHMATEKFQEISPPPCLISSSQSNFKSLGVLGGCLCLIDAENNDHSDIWVMKSYGVQESWSKEYVLKKEGYCGYWTGDYEAIQLKNGDVLLQHLRHISYQMIGPLNWQWWPRPVLHDYERKLVHYYDPKRNAYKHIVSHGIPSSAERLLPIIHVGSLISPKNSAT